MNVIRSQEIFLVIFLFLIKHKCKMQMQKYVKSTHLFNIESHYWDILHSCLSRKRKISNYVSQFLVSWSVLLFQEVCKAALNKCRIHTSLYISQLLLNLKFNSSSAQWKKQILVSYPNIRLDCQGLGTSGIKFKNP